MDRRPATAHELGQFVYEIEGPGGRTTPRQANLRRGLQVHARVEMAHMGHPVATERPFPWDWLTVAAFLLLVLGVALWTH